MSPLQGGAKPFPPLTVLPVNTIPIWVPLVVAGLGVLGTIAGTLSGVLLTQKRSDRRERESWERERKREHERWAREDALRTFERRREAYEDFYESLRTMARTAYDHGMGLSEPHGDDGELPFDWNQDTWRKLQHLRVYASTEVASAAMAAYSACWYWGFESRHGRHDDPFDDGQDTYDRREPELHDAIRRDLGIEQTDLPTPAPTDH